MWHCMVQQAEKHLLMALRENVFVCEIRATAVVEGCGDHGCEYMTGGRVVVLLEEQEKTLLLV